MYDPSTIRSTDRDSKANYWVVLILELPQVILVNETSKGLLSHKKILNKYPLSYVLFFRTEIEKALSDI